MAGDATGTLLQEIRDLQKQQLDCLRASITNQEQSLANQHQSLAVQQQSVERQKMLLARTNKLWMMVVGIIFALFFLSYLPSILKPLLGQ